MNNKRLSQRAIEGTVLLTIGQVTSYALSFVRNIILARSLSKADFGIAAVLGLAVTLMEIAGRMSFGQQIIQSPDGECRRFMATSHAFQFVLASAGALAMLILSYPAALAYGVPHLTWAFALLSLVLFARGFENLDYYREQRELRYMPAVLYEFIPQVITTAAAWPLILWLKDFRAIVVLMLLKAAMTAGVTHIIARQPYRWQWDIRYLRNMWAFGWPLLLNGLLMFGSQQADQMVVGSFLSLSDVASYALVLSVVSIPGVIFGQVSSALMLPILSRCRSDQVALTSSYKLCLQFSAVSAIVLTLPLVIGGEHLIRLFFGAKYQNCGPIVAALGAAAALRFLRAVPAVCAMSRGDTVTQLHANIWRLVSLPAAVLVVLTQGSLVMVAWCAVFAEVISTVACLVRLRSIHSIPLRLSYGSVAYILLFLAAGFCLTPVMMKLNFLWSFAMIAAAVAVSLVAASIAFPAGFQAVFRKNGEGQHLGVTKQSTTVS